jgi:hypothetical protein
MTARRMRRESPNCPLGRFRLPGRAESLSAKTYLRTGFRSSCQNKWGTPMATESVRSPRPSDPLHTAQELERYQKKENTRQEALVGERVLHDLGKPRDLLQVQVRPVWENTYRVNIFVGASAASARIVNSFFVVTDADGKVIESTPRVSRQY